MSIIHKVRGGFTKFRLYIVTLSYLRPIQLIYQIYYRVRKPVKLRDPGPVEFVSIETISWPSYQLPATHDAVHFDFLGLKGELSEDWSFEGYEKLWIYNLHYLNDISILNGSVPANVAEKLILKWLDGNREGSGIGWEPYPLSLRLVNLLKFFTAGNGSNICQNENVVQSIAQQASFLMTRLEYHILANHLFVNAKALVFAGSLVSCHDSASWLKKGLYILDKEIPEQFLSDGGHFELSPMYHAALIWDMCDLILLAKSTLCSELLVRSAEWKRVVSRGVTWLRLMTHPDKKIAFFNDAAFGIAPSLEHIEYYCRMLDIPVDKIPRGINTGNGWVLSYLEQSGYISVSDEDNGHRGIIDVAKVGPEYQPGHAHADTLSFELSLFGHRVFVNSGTSQYGVSPERDQQRGTVSHNTMMIDGRNSSDVWAGFRVARRANPFDINIRNHGRDITVSACHDGYKTFSHDVIVKRTWSFSEGCLVINDCVSGNMSSAVCLFYCHPDIDVVKVAHGVQLSLPEGSRVLLQTRFEDSISLSDSVWHPHFGVSLPNKCIEIKLSEHELETLMTW